jgi:glycyl-tRNA synthetase beta chain
MVYEFPELQGIMGEYYSVAQGEDKAVGQSIRESYLPRFAGDDLPESQLGMIVSIADKIDSIVGFFAMDLEPSGSQDPYALRRQAMGITQIILSGGLDLHFGKLIDFAYDQIASRYQTKKTKEETKERVYLFMAQRLENVLSEDGLKYDTVNAVLTKTPDDFCLLRKKGEALAAFRDHENFEPLMAGFTRVHNLAKNAADSAFDESVFVDPAEKELVNAFKEFKEKAEKALFINDFNGAFHAIAALRGPIDAFLTDIMVMCEDEALKKSRLGLLKSISDEMLKAADFTAIVMAK